MARKSEIAIIPPNPSYRSAASISRYNRQRSSAPNNDPNNPPITPTPNLSDITFTNDPTNIPKFYNRLKLASSNLVLALSKRKSDKNSIHSLLKMTNRKLTIPNSENKLKQMESLLSLKMELDRVLQKLKDHISKVDSLVPENQREDDFYDQHEKYNFKNNDENEMNGIHMNVDNNRVPNFSSTSTSRKYSKMPVETLNIRKNGIQKHMIKLMNVMQEILRTVLEHKNRGDLYGNHNAQEFDSSPISLDRHSYLIQMCLYLFGIVNSMIETVKLFFDHLGLLLVGYDSVLINAEDFPKNLYRYGVKWWEVKKREEIDMSDMVYQLSAYFWG